MDFGIRACPTPQADTGQQECRSRGFPTHQVSGKQDYLLADPETGFEEAPRPLRADCFRSER